MALEDKVTICSNINCNMEYLFKANIKPSKDICSKCGSKLIHTSLTAEEHFLIQHISKDRDFLMAMIELKKNNIIEYQTKIAQYKQIAKADGCYTSALEKVKQNQPKCPTCGSTNIQKISGTKRAASIIGFGILSSNIGKTYECLNCKYKW